MADEDKSSKTEKPTGKKLNDAKKQGQNAQSQELQSWAVLMGVTFVLLVLAPWSMTSISMINIKFIQQPHAIPVDLLHLREVMMQLVQEVGMIVLPIMVLFLVIGVSIMIGQIGWTISTEKIKLEISKFSPAKGIKKMVSVRQVMTRRTTGFFVATSRPTVSQSAASLRGARCSRDSMTSARFNMSS